MIIMITPTEQTHGETALRFRVNQRSLIFRIFNETFPALWEAAFETLLDDAYGMQAIL